MKEQLFEFTADQPGERLDRTIVGQLGEKLSRSQIQALIRDGLVTVNNAPAKAGMRLKGGETIRVVVPPASDDTTVEPEPIDLNVLYEDDLLAVIDKPAGLIVHPGAGNETGTLVNAILHRWPQIGEMNYAPKRRGIVHRLDKDTSGLLLVAKDQRAMQHLMRQFQQRSVEKIYLALLERAPKTPTGRIEVPIMRDPNQRRKMIVHRAGRPAISEYAVIERFRTGQVLVRVRLLTGRTHQIRVHMAFMEAPVVGDTLYGYRKAKFGLRRQFLHAARLCFDHPTTGERLCFESPLPPELETVLSDLRRAGAP
ncbi:MAG: RluA family pseudouridine synthase [Chloroflexota bacterium]|nr:MAG: RNA pseudouridine synthase [Chloroflexota bacterium]